MLELGYIIGHAQQILKTFMPITLTFIAQWRRRAVLIVALLSSSVILRHRQKHITIKFIPPYYVRSGYVSIGGSALRYSGFNGYVWPRTAPDDITKALFLNLNDIKVYPSGGDSRNLAFPVQLVKPLQVQPKFLSVKSADFELY